MISVQKFRKQFSAAQTKEIRGHQKLVATLAWNPDGKKLASGSADHTIRIHTLERTMNKDSIELKGHSGQVDKLCWDPTHTEKLATASYDRSVKIWDCRTAKSASHTIKTGGENINISWSPDGKRIAVGDKGDLITFIDPRGGSNGPNKFIINTMKNDVEVNEFTWSWDNAQLFLTTGAGTIKIIDSNSLDLLHTVHASTSNCYCIEMDPKGRYFVVGSADAITSLWDLEDYCCVSTFGKLDWPVRTLGLSYDGEFIASGSEDFIIDISHVESGESVHSIKTSELASALAWHPSRYLLAYSTDLDNNPQRREGGREGVAMVFGF